MAAAAAEASFEGRWGSFRALVLWPSRCSTITIIMCSIDWKITFGPCALCCSVLCLLPVLSLNWPVINTYHHHHHYFSLKSACVCLCVYYMTVSDAVAFWLCPLSVLADPGLGPSLIASAGLCGAGQAALISFWAFQRLLGPSLSLSFLYYYYYCDKFGPKWFALLFFSLLSTFQKRRERAVCSIANGNWSER